MKKFLIVFIILFAAIIRLSQLGIIPPSPDWDEAALGYNAYSILHTGRDEYGAFMPIVMRSFDDYKPALYAYFSVPTIAVFGLNTFAVRLPSALFGIITILTTYLLVKELFKKENVALLSAGLLAISPWHIQFSRIAFESNVGLSLNILGILLFVKSFKKPWFLIFSSLSFVLSLYVYQSEKVFVPLILLTMCAIYRREIFAVRRRYIFAAIIIGILTTLPMLMYIATSKNALARAQGVSVFAETSFLKTDAQRLIDDQKNHDYAGFLLDNRRLIFAKEIVANYFSHYDLNWLFITGDLSRHHAPNMGLLYLWELPFVLLGMYVFLFGNYDRKTKIFLIVWYLITPIPASVTTGVPHAVRALNFLPTYQIFTAIGVITAYEIFKRRKNVWVWGITLLIGVITCINIAYYFNQYFVQLNYYTSEDWQYGYKSAAEYVTSVQENYNKIIVSNQPPLDQSYMFFLFHLQYDPALYQQQSLLASGGFREDHLFGKYEFRAIQWNLEKEGKNVLYVGRPGDVPPSVHILKQINYLDDKPAIMIFTR